MAKLGFKDKNMNWAFQESQDNWYQSSKMEKPKGFDNTSYRESRLESPSRRLPVPSIVSDSSTTHVPVTAAGYIDDRVHNTFLEEIYSDIGLKDTIDLDLFEFDNSDFVPFNPPPLLPEGEHDQTISFSDRQASNEQHQYLEQQDNFIALAKGYCSDSVEGNPLLSKNLTDDDQEREKLKNLKSIGSHVEIKGSITHLNKALASPTVTSSSHSSDSKEPQFFSRGPSSMSSTAGSPQVHSTNRCSSREGSEDMVSSPRPPGSAASNDSQSSTVDKESEKNNLKGKSDLSRCTIYPPNNSPSSLPASPAKVKLEQNVHRAKSVDDFISLDKSRSSAVTGNRLEKLDESPDKNDLSKSNLTTNMNAQLDFSENASNKINKSGVMAFRLTPELRPISPSKTPQHLMWSRRIVHPTPPSLSVRTGEDGVRILGPEFRDRSGLSSQKVPEVSAVSKGSSPPMEQVSKRARVISNGNDLLEDVRQSYQYVQGADMFARPTLSTPHVAAVTPQNQNLVGLPRQPICPQAIASNQVASSCNEAVSVNVQVPQYQSNASSFNADSRCQEFNQNNEQLWNKYNNEQQWNKQMTPYSSEMDRNYEYSAGGTPNYRQLYMQKIMTRRNMLESNTNIVQSNNRIPQQLNIENSRVMNINSNYGPTSLNQPSTPFTNRLTCSQQQLQQQQLQMGTSSSYEFSVAGGEMLATPSRNDRQMYPAGPVVQGRVGQSWSTAPYDDENQRLIPQVINQQVPSRSHCIRDSTASPSRYSSGREISDGVASPLVIEDLSNSRPMQYYGSDCGNVMPKAAVPRVSSAGGYVPYNQGSLPPWPDYTRPASTGRSTPGHGNIGTPAYPREDYRVPGLPFSVPANMVGSVYNSNMPFNEPNFEGNSHVGMPIMASGQPTIGFSQQEGLVQHIMNDRTNMFRSHPFFPLLRDLIIADMNFHSASFPFQLIANLPVDFNRLLQNYMSRNPAAANYHCNDTVEKVIMDALRFAHQAIMDKIQARKQMEAEKGITRTMNPIDDFCERFDRAVQRNVPENIVHPVSRQQGLNVAPYADIPLSGNTISKPVIPCSQSAPCTPQKSALKQNLRGISGDTASEFGSPSETDSPGRSSNGGGSTTKNKVLPKEAVATMLQWLRDHQSNPYPNDDEKEQLIQQTKLTINQINYWFTNARRRILPKWALQRYMEQQHQQGMHYGIPPPHAPHQMLGSNS